MVLYRTRWLLVALLVLVLAGCGGGGGGGGGSDPVPAPPAAPTANPNAYTVDENGSITVDAATGVLTNDSDPQNAPLSAELMDDVTHGTLNLRPDGSFDYTHTAMNADDDSFSYRATNGTGVSNTTTVTLQVNGPPIAGDSCDNIASSAETLAGNLATLVTDPDGDTTFTYQIIQDGSKGSTTVDPNTGAFTYSPMPSVRGEDSLTYEVRDPLGATATGTVKVVIDKTRIMPLGDSITAGITGPVTGEPNDLGLRIGYRKKLYDDLIAAGYPIDFVGSIQSGQGAGLSDPDHAGFPGARDDNLADPNDVDSAQSNTLGTRYVPTVLDTFPADVILLDIGANDVNSSVSGAADVSPDDVDQILQDIQTWEDNNNHVTVFLAKITDRETQFYTFPSPYVPNPDVVQFNMNITTVAENRFNNLNDDIMMVDQFSALTYPNDLTAGQAALVHPNTVGYEKMADTWFNVIVASGKIPKCP